jgi:hypothetical protein
VNGKLKKTAVSFVLISFLLSNGYSAIAADASEPTVTAQAPSVYALTDRLNVEIKGILNEHVAEGTQVMAANPDV